LAVYNGVLKLTRTWLCGYKAVNLIGLHWLIDADQVGRIRHVSAVDLEVRAGFMGIQINVVDGRLVERRRPRS
jgi:hypothetical protein